MATTDELRVVELRRAAGKRWDPLLAELAELARTDGPIVSLYLDMKFDDEAARSRTRIAIKEQARRLRLECASEALAAEMFAELDRVEAIVDEQVHDRSNGGGHGRGLAVFRDGRASHELAVRTAAPMPNLLAFANTTMLRPLVTAAGSMGLAGRALCVVLDSTKMRLYELAPDGAERLRTVIGDVPRRHSMGGWSQLKLQHWRDEEIGHQLARAANAIAEEFVARSEQPRILVGGKAELVHRLLRELPLGAREATRHVTDVNAGEREPSALAAFERALEILESEELEAHVREIIDEAAAGGRACAGEEAVITAMNAGRVDDVVISARYCESGWRCTSCRSVGAATQGDRIATDPCPICAGRRIAVELGEALLHSAIARDARYTVVPASAPSLLETVGSIAARLRY